MVSNKCELIDGQLLSFFFNSLALSYFGFVSFWKKVQLQRCVYLSDNNLF